MKRNVWLILMLLLVPFISRAQQSLELYYIAHDHYETQLTNILKEVRQNARYNTSKTVLFYLSNVDSPKWMVVSPNDEKEYKSLIEEINGQSSHNIYPEVDRMKLIELLSSPKITGGKELSSYESVVFNYYINPTFAVMSYGDSIIGRLYWDLDLDSVPRNKLEINIYYHSDDGFNYNEKQLFGRQNLLNGFPVLIDTF